MRFIFKTDYAQDLQLFKHGGQTFWYGALAVALVFVPWLLSPYFVSQLTFVLIYSIVALGLMLLSGFIERPPSDPRLMAVPQAGQGFPSRL